MSLIKRFHIIVMFAICFGGTAIAQDFDPFWGDQRALGGAVDYNPSLMSLLFDEEEIELMIKDQQRNSAPAVQNAAKRGSGNLNSQAIPKALTTTLKKPEKAVAKPGTELMKEPVKELAVEPEKEPEVATPNYVRGYIILANEHRNNFRSYELYEDNGMLLGSGPLYNRKSIRVPWSVDGEIGLMLHATNGITRSFRFNTVQ